MTLFRVWAPRPKRIELEVAAKRIPMRAGEGGWWHADADAPPGTEYGYVLDGEGPFPDPRSAWQPGGVHGPSRLVDHGEFDWSDAGWNAGPLPDGLIYELHTGTFSPEGTFVGVISKLDHLAELGLTHVEVMPVASFPGRHGWGYDGVDLYAPHEPYGGPRGLKALVDACHSRGLAVILDVVYNHLGPSGNYLAPFGPYFTDRHRTPWGEAINLDAEGSDEVRRFIIDNALMWLRDYHFDGLRIDAIDTLFDHSAVNLLEQLSAEVDLLEAQLGRRLVLIAESDLNDPRVIRPRDAGGYGIDAQWSDDLHHALHAVLTGEDKGYYSDFGKLGDVTTALTEGYVYSGRYSVARRRSHGRPLGGLGGTSLVGCLQNHDQVGNRACGDRLGQLLSPARLKVAAALLMTSTHIPMLFQGEEWSADTPFLYFTDHDDRALGRAITEGRRREFAAFSWSPESVPDPQVAGTFEASRLDWTELEAPEHREVFDWYRSLIALRASEPSLRDGRLDEARVRCDEDERWLVVERGPIVVACNLGVPRRLDAGHGELSLLLASDHGIEVDEASVNLPMDSVAILRRR